MNDMLADVLLHPENQDFALRCSGWNSRVVHRPDYIVVARTPEHVQQAVRFAARQRLPIYVQSTGHGALAACEGGVLIDTSSIDGVEVDVDRRCATVGAGVRWQELLDVAQIYGLAGLSGSGSSVGVVGYALGGGSGWLFRRYGLCSDTIEAAEITTADGLQRWVRQDVEPDLLWALRGGGGNFGVVTALRLRLVPAPTVYAGAIYWPMTQARAVLSAYRTWLEAVPADVGSAVAFLQYPSHAPVPDPVRGKPVVALRICHPGPAEQADQMLAPMRQVAGIVFDTTRVMPYCEIGSVTMDSPLHLPRIGYSESLRELAEPMISALPEVLTPGAPFLAMELRHTGKGASSPPTGYEGLGYWNSPFLFMGMSVTSDASAERRAAELGRCLDMVFEPYRTGTNAFTFLMPQHTPAGGGDVERVRQVYWPSHYGRLASLKAQYDPDNIFGRDRNIPPAPGPC